MDFVEVPDRKAKKIRDKNILGGVFIPQQERLRVPNTFHARYTIGGSQTENKVYSFSNHTFTFHG